MTIFILVFFMQGQLVYELPKSRAEACRTMHGWDSAGMLALQVRASLRLGTKVDDFRSGLDDLIGLDVSRLDCKPSQEPGE